MGNQTAVPVCKAFQQKTSEQEEDVTTLRSTASWDDVITTTSQPFLLLDNLETGDYSYITTNVSTGLVSTLGSHQDPPPEAMGRSWQWFEVAITILTVLGVVGNILNLLVLSSRRMSSDRIGRSMNLGLISLAISDMLFCLVVFPYTFVPQDLTPTTGNNVLKFYYRIYGIACINLFMMSGTWIVMFMSVSRYIGIVHPLKARDSLCTTKMPIILTFMFITSILVTSPYFVHLSVLPCTNGTQVFYEMRPSFPKKWTMQLVFYIRWVWPIIADFFPLLLLVYCNSRLIIELHRTSKSRKETCPGQMVKSTSNRVTVTLIAVVLMLLIFVSPAEILKYINPYKAWGKAGFVVANVANVMQVVNFSSNFLLYCAINPKFRAAARGIVLDACCLSKASRSSVSDRSRQTAYSSCSGGATGHWKSNMASARGTDTALGSYKQINNCRTSAI